jgi:hypothetical protein
MEASHFNPRFSPLLVHWEMIGQNLQSHLSGGMPRIAQGAPAVTGAEGAGAGVAASARLGISESDQAALLGGFDLWWMYARYAGLPGVPLTAAALLLLSASLWLCASAMRAASREENDA